MKENTILELVPNPDSNTSEPLSNDALDAPNRRKPYCIKTWTFYQPEQSRPPHISGKWVFHDCSHEPDAAPSMKKRKRNDETPSPF